MIRALFAAVWSIVQIWSSLSGCSNRGAGSFVCASVVSVERTLLFELIVGGRAPRRNLATGALHLR